MAALEDEGTGDADLETASRDFKRLETTHIKTGQREGVAAGKDETLRSGFAAGYCSGLQAGLHWAVLKGKLSALQSLCPDAGARAEVGELLSEAASLQKSSEEEEKERGRKQRSAEGEGLAEATTLAELLTATAVPAGVAELERKLEEILSKCHVLPGSALN